jgi:16S rRNA (uracil1498-N3)-methyltransferase
MANMKTDNKLDKGFIKTNNICLMIGPEGGFSDKEIIQALESNVKEITLGKNRLRTETAAIYFISAIKSLTN